MLTMTMPAEIERLRVDETTPALDVLKGINETLHRLWPDEERFSFQYWGITPSNVSPYEKAKGGMPFWTLIGKGWLAIYYVEGSSEGHYIHVDMHGRMGKNGRGRFFPIMSLKCFGGEDRAEQIVKLLHHLLSA